MKLQDTISYWNKTAEHPEYPKLKQSIETDVLIIGGGITGVTCAYCLTQKGLQPTLIEAGGLCDGTTGNTTGKVTIQHGYIYHRIADEYGIEFAQGYADSQTQALRFVEETVKKLKIDCQLAENTAYLFTYDENESEKIRKEYETAKRLDIETEFFENPVFPKGSLLLLGYKNQAFFHSVRYIKDLAKAAADEGARIFCDTKAIRLNDGDIKTVECENGISIKAKHVVMATQYPFYDGPNLFYTRLYANRDYGIALLAKRGWPDGSYVNLETPTRSIRTHIEDGKRILIIVGDSHATGRGEEDTEVHFNNLINYADEIAGVDEVLAKWSAQDYKTPDNIPYIGRISDNSSVYVASGYGKWGLSNGTLAGMMISELIVAGSCRYEEIYSRKRHDLSTGAGVIASEVAGQVGELIKSKFEKTEGIEDLRQGEGRVINFKGRRAGIYRDENDNVTIVDITCTHLGTELNFNPAEKTWDCPAHGGRYSIEGKLLEGPPKDCLKFLYKGRFADLS